MEIERSMEPYLAASAILALAIGTIVGCSRGHEMEDDNVIEYHGQAIKLSKSYSDYDDYKNDPGNLDPTELTRVERLVSEAPIAKSFVSEQAMIEAISEIKFPGYGLSSSSGDVQPDGTYLEVNSAEIPGTEKNRVVVFRCGNGKYELLDDFILPPDLMVMRVREEDGKLIYGNFGGHTVLTRTPFQKE